MKIVICSMGYSGYSTACWRALAGVPGVDLVVYTPETDYPYQGDVLAGLDVKILDTATFSDVRSVCDKVVAEKPEAITIGGWASSAFKALAYDVRLQRTRKLLAMDSMWTGTIRQIGARWALRGLVRRLDGVIVAGERGRQFARWMGFRSNQVFTSTYGYDSPVFNPVYEQRLRLPEWPCRFCFVGRYVPVKGVEALLAAYRTYRKRVTHPWELHCFGKGPITVEGDGVVDHGFIQPKDLPGALREQGVFVLPSLHEPWGVALAEAAGAGLPLICSDMVASGIDLVRDYYNGIVFPAGDTGRLVAALVWMHEHSKELSIMGQRSQSYAGAYTPKVWAARWLDACSRRN